jgi:hypothetical protein
MIQFTLKCDAGHSYDSWFKSSEAFDGLRASGHLSCAVCGSASVEKALMAPRIAAASAGDGPARGGDAAGDDAQSAGRAVAMAPDARMRKALAALRREVEARSDYVGDAFAREARAMHLGEAPERPIYGEARPAEAKALIEDGVPVLPLPFRPSRKAH